MSTQYGKQLDSWKAICADKAQLLRAVEEATAVDLQDSLSDVQIEKDVIEDEPDLGESIVIRRQTGTGRQAVVLLRFAHRDQNDLEITWQLFSQSGGARTRDITLGIISLVIGYFTLAFIIGIVFIGIGGWLLGTPLGWWGEQYDNVADTSPTSPRSLAEAVNRALVKALRENGVTVGELRVVQRSQIAGMGRLDW